RERYAKHMTRREEEISVSESSESPRDRKNRLAREVYALRRANETTEETEQHRTAQRQVYTRRIAAETIEEAEYENAEQADLRKKKQNEAKYNISNAAHIKNYDTNAVRRHNVGRMNICCTECKALHWIEEKVAGTKKLPIFSTCCTKGKVQLPDISPPPPLL
ncbi:3583_t:CDS:2, partial [Racocetra fulgida]